MSTYPFGTYTTLAVGMVGLTGTVCRSFPLGGGRILADGQFPNSSVVGSSPSPLEAGVFEFLAPLKLCVGTRVSFDIVQGNFSVKAANVAAM